MKSTIIPEYNSELRPFGMLFALEAAAEETKKDEHGGLYIETLDGGTSKTSDKL